LNFQFIELYILTDEDTKFDLLVKVFATESIKDEINFISDYFFVPKYIKKLEGQGLNICKSIKILDDVRSLLKIKD